MHCGGRGIALALGFVLSAAPAVFTQSAAPVFRTSTNMVVLQVTVTGPAIQNATLTPADFTVFEDGRPQPVTFFERDRAPLALSFLLDTSDSMDENLPLAEEAAVAFSRHLGPADLASVVAFNQHVKTLQAFARPSDVESAIRRAIAGGTTALYNALYVSIREFEHVSPAEDGLRRHAIVLLSDGEDTSSLIGFDDAFDLARQSNVSIYAVRIGPAPLSIHGVDEGRAVLEQFARATGGRAYFVARPADLLPVYTQIADELSRQYTLAYAPPPSQRDGKWHDLAVRVERPNLAARTRTGYLASH